MTTVLIAGSFDPITLGHLDIIERATRSFCDVVVAVGVNGRKTYSYSLDERRQMVEVATAHLDGVRVTLMEGTLIDCARAVGASSVVKGVRSSADLEWELAQAVINSDLGGIETLLIPARPEYAIVSSSVVRELLSLGMDASRYVPATIRPLLVDNDQ